jgi:hypothetical protein
MRTSGRLRPLRKVISASGSLATFASRTIRPVASTTHTLLCSNDVDPGIVIHGCSSMMLGADHVGPRSTTPSL